MTEKQKFELPDSPRLLILPIPACETKRRRRKSACIGQKVEPEPGIKTAALAYGVVEMKALTSFVGGQLEGTNKRAMQTKDWLDELSSSFDELESAVVHGHFETGVVRIDDSELGGLHEVLEGRPQWSTSTQSYPSSMLKFWVDEVYRRGWEVLSLALGELTIHSALTVSRTVASLRYPIL